MVGRQLPFFSVIVPFWLIWAFAGWRGMMGIWPAILVAGAVVRGAAVPGVELSRAVAGGHRRGDRVDGVARPVPARLASVATAGSQVIVSACGTTTARRRRRAADVIRAWVPWLILSVLVFIWGMPQVKAALDAWTTVRIPVPGLHNLHRARATGRGGADQGTGNLRRLLAVGHRHRHLDRRRSSPAS